MNPANKVKALTQSQMMDIFSGKLDNWKQLGGADRSINIYTRDEASGTRAVFWKKGLKKGPISSWICVGKRPCRSPTWSGVKNSVVIGPTVETLTPLVALGDCSTAASI